MVIEFRESTIKKGLIIIFASVGILMVIGYLFLFSDSSTQVEAGSLREEFEGAYSEEVEENGEIVEVDITASETEVEIVDGYSTKVWSYNGQVPGPEIRINLGDTLKVNFKNELPQETTIHWHGVRVPNAMDGVPDVTQKPVKPGGIFTYEFTPKDAGTFWFHPHVRGSEQVERGLYGTLIVEDQFSDKYSQDVVWVLDDWRMTEDYQVDPEFVTRHDLAHDGRWGNVITVNGDRNEVLELEPGERIRLRLVNTSNGRVYQPSFGELTSYVIAVDGMYVKEPFQLDDFELAPGNRIDLDITIPTELDNRTISVYDNYTRYPNRLASIRVGSETVETPSFKMPNNSEVPEWKRYQNYPLDGEYILDARRGGEFGIEWTMNGKAFPAYEKIELNYDSFNRIKFTNKSARLHPMHLHGQFFKVLSRNGELSNENYFRDTVLVDPRETVEIGLVPLDRGDWMNHCHVLEHADAGMMTVVEVK
jgi:FtsP/CotA-like multicopper oxidase with cupredoxin domain